MCISTAALAAFLTLIGAEHVSTETDRVIVHATTADAHWVAAPEGDLWCAMAPQLDRMARFSEAAAE